jgi:uncharacterized protein with PIN domain
MLRHKNFKMFGVEIAIEYADYCRRKVKVREGKIKPHRCPRCNTELWYSSLDKLEEAKLKKVQICCACYAAYTIAE